eukprot:gnl/MRDRNA2_/MRDRNA2_60558_c0_seq1.p1 gnl/MRDRNA2_/MRDRNA2_60558_c0~~gnl/MRDRNA2_/MRDRNA2_60558_c0_seq1.p1  ORF type:complete len:200 (+),score=55.85 gnl/MRDRNA2_/MRDRNA2_60558_c0_seq1:108-707(+)
MKGKGKGDMMEMMKNMGPMEMMMMEQMAMTEMMMMMGMSGMGGMMGGKGKGRGKRGGGGGGGDGDGMTRGEKRKLEETTNPAKEARRQRPKNKFLDAVQLIITKNHQRNMNKGDVTWESKEEGGKYTCTVTLSVAIGEEGGQSFTGEPGDTALDAEMSAATVAYDSMKSVIEPLEEAHLAKKPKKSRGGKRHRKEKDAS